MKIKTSWDKDLKPSTGQITYLILFCPVCGFTQNVELNEFNNYLKYQGHPYTCGENHIGENYLARNTLTAHTNLQIKGIVIE